MISSDPQPCAQLESSRTRHSTFDVMRQLADANGAQLRKYFAIPDQYRIGNRRQVRNKTQCYIDEITVKVVQYLLKTDQPLVEVKTLHNGIARPPIVLKSLPRSFGEKRKRCGATASITGD